MLNYPQVEDRWHWESYDFPTLELCCAFPVILMDLYYVNLQLCLKQGKSILSNNCPLSYSPSPGEGLGWVGGVSE